MKMIAKIFKRLRLMLLSLPFKLVFYRSKPRIIRSILGRQQKADNALKQPAENILLILSFRVSSLDRLAILKTSMDQNLKLLNKTDILLKVADASPQAYSSQAKAALSADSKVRLELEFSQEKLAPSYFSLLSQASQSYFCMLFDDQPIVGLNEAFLSASCQLLSDFAGLVDLVYISDTEAQNIDHKNKQLIFGMAGLDFRARGIKPLRIVKYGQYSFVIVENKNFGFFFNTYVGRRQDYMSRLGWYLKNVSVTSDRLIEIAASRFYGPAYRFLAIPLEVFQINIDFVHTPGSFRNYSGSLERELFQALNDNYQIVHQPANI
jgi:hypothetical protein